tara:strand:+ start:2189 stop:3748 length:1560 start_codon:yes stop_codon:yes gene_type:complete
MIYQIYKTLRIIFFTLFVCISFYSINLYEGSVTVYIAYCLSLILMLFYLTDKKATYFEIFFSAYFFLGFWFKYVFSLLLFDGIVFDSDIEQVPFKNIDEILVLGTWIALICILSSFIFRNLKKKYLFQNKINFEKSFFIELYLKNRIAVLIVFLIFVVLIAFFNTKLGIHQRGFIYYHELPSIITNLIKWLLLFGFTTFSCFIFHAEIKHIKKINIFTIIIMLAEVFFSYTSMLSRSFIINASCLILPIYQQSTKFIKKYDLKLITLFIIILFLTTFSVQGVNKIRLEKLEIVKAEYKELTEKEIDILLDNDPALEKKLKNYNFQIPKKEIDPDLNSKLYIKAPKVTPRDVINFILVNRWIGIDSLILVSNKKNKNYDLFFRALKEEKDNTDYTFYEKEFGLVAVKTNVDTGKTVLKGNTLPGIISFLYYTGSSVFLLLSIMLIFFIFNLLENILRKVTDNNLVFTCFISNMIATRLFHFGYAPKDSYMFLISILLSVFFIILLMRFKFSLPGQKNKIN